MFELIIFLAIPFDERFRDIPLEFKPFFLEYIRDASADTREPRNWKKKKT
jgi:hypothetical protein